MTLRAPEPEANPDHPYPLVRDTIFGRWEPSKWWRVVDADGRTIAESSNMDSDTVMTDALANGGELERMLTFKPDEVKWRKALPWERKA